MYRFSGIERVQHMVGLSVANQPNLKVSQGLCMSQVIRKLSGFCYLYVYLLFIDSFI